MVLFIALGVIVLMTFVVLGILFYELSKEVQKKEEVKAVPLTDLEQLRNELSSKVQNEVKQSSAELDIYKKRAQELEEQSNEARQSIESLTKENESLKSQQADLEQAKQKLIDLEGEASGLKSDNSNLQTQLEITKIQMEELNREKEILSSAPKPESDQDLRQELEVLKYELVKAKAQSSGLERVSFNYKNQLEDFLKKINAAQVANDHLSQVKNRLEGMVEEVKIQNEELVHKDQLAQFELEKNRTRLVNLEREYEDLKARTHQKDPQV